MRLFGITAALQWDGIAVYCIQYKGIEHIYCQKHQSCENICPYSALSALPMFSFKCSYIGWDFQSTQSSFPSTEVSDFN